MTGTRLTDHEARQRLREIVRKDVSFNEKAREALELGKQYLSVDNGYLTQIDRDTDHWEIVVTTDTADGQAPPGLELELQDTYCRETIENDTPLTLHDAPDQGWGDDPAVERSGDHTYIGIPLITEQEPYGTVCFAAQDPRSDSFSEAETQFAHHLTQLLERELEKDLIEGELTNQTNLATVLHRVLRHNLRNEISVIRGYTTLMAEQVDDDSVGKTVLDHIDDLIDLSQKARKLEEVVTTSSERQTTEIGTLIEEIAAEITQEFPEASIAVDYDNEIHGRVLQNFDRAIEEIIENAVKHTGDNPTVTVAIEIVPNGVEIQISDNGPGLPDTEAEVLNSGVETPLAHGSGLGLWLAYWIVSSHDGSIDPEITEHGTTMTVTIPRKPDVTVQQQVTELTRSRDKYKITFEEATDGMTILNDESRIIDANAAASTIFGVEDNELLGRSLTEFLPDEFAFESEWQDIGKAGVERDTTTVTGADGVERIIEYSGTAGIIPGQHLLVSRDITERRERERRYEAIFNQTNQFTALLEPDGTVIEANEPALEFGSLDLEDVVGKPFYETAWWQLDDATQQELQDAIDRAAAGEFVRYEVEIQGGEENAIIDFSIRPITDERGNVTLLVPEGRNITERKEREVELQETKQRLELALQGTNTGIWEWKVGSAEMVWNESMERLFGLEHGTFEGTFDAFEKRIHPGDRQDVEEAIAASVQTNESFQLEFRLERPDGEQRWVDARAEIHTDDDGGNRMVGVVTDITERKERERELSMVKERYETLLEAAPDPVFVADGETGELIEVNEAAETLLGMSSDEIIGMHQSELHPSEQTERYQEFFEEHVESGGSKRRLPDGSHLTIVTATGGRVPVEISVATVSLPDGPVTYGIFRDVSEQVAREQELEAITQRHQLALEGTDTGVWDWTIGTGKVRWDESLERLVGIKPGTFESTFDAFGEYVHPADREKVTAAVERAAETESRFQTEYRLQRENDTHIWVESRGEIYDDGSDTKRMIGIVTDITERKEGERELELAESLFENTQDALFVIDVTEDREFYIERVNAVYEKLIGFSNAEIAGKTPTEALGNEIGSEMQSQYRECVERQETIIYPEEISVDGEQRLWETKITPVISEGRVDRLVGVTRDVAGE